MFAEMPLDNRTVYKSRLPAATSGPSQAAWNIATLETT